MYKKNKTSTFYKGNILRKTIFNENLDFEELELETRLQ